MWGFKKVKPKVLTKILNKLLVLVSTLNEVSETLVLIFPQIKCSKNIKSKTLKINSTVGVK